MGDLTVTTAKPKEGGGSSAILCPMLTTTNYAVWSLRMKILLQLNKAWEIIETNDENKEKNILAMALLFQSIPEALVLQVGELGSANKVWEAIKLRYVGAERVKEARLQTLMNEFDRLKMKDSETIDEFVGKLSTVASKTAALGESIEESKLVKKFLKSLPRKKYIHMIASLEKLLDLNTIGFEDVIGRLKAFEERVHEEDEIQEEQSKLMYANTQYNQDRNEGYRNRGRRGHTFPRGRGRRRNGGRDLS